jgi:hypothetical protein
MVKGGEGSGRAPADEGGGMRTDNQGIGADRRGAQIEPRIQTEIGKHLRAIYDDVINEPVPSKFMELLEELERSTARKG